MGISKDQRRDKIYGSAAVCSGVLAFAASLMARSHNLTVALLFFSVGAISLGVAALLSERAPGARLVLLVIAAVLAILGLIVLGWHDSASLTVTALSLVFVVSVATSIALWIFTRLFAEP